MNANGKMRCVQNMPVKCCLREAVFLQGPFEVVSMWYETRKRSLGVKIQESRS